VKKPSNPLFLSKIILDLSAGKYHPDYVIFEQVDSVKFTCEDEVAWCLDGENGGLHKTVQLDILHNKGEIRL
jgi:diacylglycerol kinase family enzyme